MNLYLLVAGLLTIVLLLLHTVLGEILVLRPLSRRELPKLVGSRTFMMNTLRFTWHVTSVLGWGIGVWLMFLAFQPHGDEVVWVLRLLAITFALCGVVSLVGARGKHFSWWVFFVITGLTWMGSVA